MCVHAESAIEVPQCWLCANQTDVVSVPKAFSQVEESGTDAWIPEGHT
jgi:hypothetical protein